MSPSADAEPANPEPKPIKPLPEWRRKRVRPPFPLGIDLTPDGERTGL